MKKVASATAVLTLLISGAASAADLPVAPAVSYVKPAPAALLYNWGGFLRRCQWRLGHEP